MFDGSQRDVAGFTNCRGRTYFTTPDAVTTRKRRGDTRKCADFRKWGLRSQVTGLTWG